MIILSLIILKIIKCNSIETLNKSLDLSDQTKAILNEINESKFEKENQWAENVVNKLLPLIVLIRH